ncbi:FAD-binding protein [Pseudarthrobacter sp. J1738]|uniref:FAD-binding protein n=1 Tax=unclassified Pseudarthrobacter TaxID=2647000 RepID=UPI003D2E26E4
MKRTPHFPEGAAEETTTVVIGSGLPGLAVASELSRQGIAAIIVDGLDIPLPSHTLRADPPVTTGQLPRIHDADAASHRERTEIMRHLRNYANSHGLDIRKGTHAIHLRPIDNAPAKSNTNGAEAIVPAPKQRWAIHTEDGVLLADSIVLTYCAQNQLRRMLAELGMSLTRDVIAAMRKLGIYLVGIGELVTPGHKEVLRKAKLVGQVISGATAGAATISRPSAGQRAIGYAGVRLA